MLPAFGTDTSVNVFVMSDLPLLNPTTNVADFVPFVRTSCTQSGR